MNSGRTDGHFTGRYGAPTSMPCTPTFLPIADVLPVSVVPSEGPDNLFPVVAGQFAKSTTLTFFDLLFVIC